MFGLREAPRSPHLRGEFQASVGDLSELLLVPLLLFALGACASTPRLRLVNSPEEESFGTLMVEDLSPRAVDRLAALPQDDDRWEEIVRVHTGAGPPSADQPPILGATKLEGDVLRFRPRFPLVAGLEHHASFDGALVGEPDVELVFALPRPAREPSTRVLTVDPGLDEVPANLLRIYVTFSAGMHARDVQRHFRVLDSQGKQVLDPFVDIPDGLWDREQRRLTLFFDPGRIKRGVGPNEVLGPPLQPGEEYLLVVDADLEDARGAKLVEPFTWSFRTRQDDRASPDPETWTLIAPRSAAAPLELVFGEPLDRALLERLIHIEDEAGQPLEGEVLVKEGGGRWAWTPTVEWAGGDYTVVVHPALEDLAGNAVGHLFEERLAGEESRANLVPSTRLFFRVGPPGE